MPDCPRTDDPLALAADRAMHWPRRLLLGRRAAARRRPPCRAGRHRLRARDRARRRHARRGHRRARRAAAGVHPRGAARCRPGDGGRAPAGRRTVPHRRHHRVHQGDRGRLARRPARSRARPSRTPCWRSACWASSCCSSRQQLPGAAQGAGAGARNERRRAVDVPARGRARSSRPAPACCSGRGSSGGRRRRTGSLATDPELRDVVATRVGRRPADATTPSWSTSTGSSRPRRTGTGSRRLGGLTGRPHPHAARRRRRARSASPRCAAPATRSHRWGSTGRWPSGRSTSSCTSATTSTRTTAPTADATTTPARGHHPRRLPAPHRPDPRRPRCPGAAPPPPDGDDLGRPRPGRQRLERRRQEARPRRARPVGGPGRRRRAGPPGVAARPPPRSRRPAHHVALAARRRPGRARSCSTPACTVATGRPATTSRPTSTTPSAPCSARSSGPGCTSGCATRPGRGRSSPAASSSTSSSSPGRRPLRWVNALLPNGYAVLDGRVLHDDQWDGYPAERAARRLVARPRRAGRAHGAPVRRRPLVVGVRRTVRRRPATRWPSRSTTPAVSSAAMGRAHYPACGGCSTARPTTSTTSLGRRHRARLLHDRADARDVTTALVVRAPLRRRSGEPGPRRPRRSAPERRAWPPHLEAVEPVSDDPTVPGSPTRSPTTGRPRSPAHATPPAHRRGTVGALAALAGTVAAARHRHHR